MVLRSMLNGTYGVNHYAAYLGGTGKLPPDEFKITSHQSFRANEKKSGKLRDSRGKISSQESELAANR